jgi:hypothetical protein
MEDRKYITIWAGVLGDATNRSQAAKPLSPNGKKVTEADDPQHEIDVLAFLAESNFEDFGVTLVPGSVTYKGSSQDGTYHCVFEVPDEGNYEIFVKDLEVGVPILFINYYDPTLVIGSKVGNRIINAVMDWRLLGMSYDAITDGSIEDISPFAFTYVLKHVVYNIPGHPFLQKALEIIDGVNTLDNWVNLPNVGTFINYAFILKNSENILEDNSRYEGYKQKHRLRWSGSGLVPY